MSGPIAVFGPPKGSVRVLIDGDLAASLSVDVEREWSRRCAINPKLHDGPVLHVDRFDPVSGVIVCRRTSYKAFVAGHVAGLKVESLGITGLCVRPGRAGEEVLLGRRSDRVRIYAGMWESAPRGAVEVPPEVRELDAVRLASCLAVEAREELGASVRVTGCVGFVRDADASSLDVCLRCELDGEPTGGNWEYRDRAWLASGEVARWARGFPPEGFRGQMLSPPCAAWFAAGSG